MPTNLFDNPKTLRQRSAGNLGFDVPSMIQGQVPQIMQDVEERRQMGRKKYAEDILQQQLQSSAQELQNRAAGYHLGQEQQYYDNPATSKMFQDYLGRMGFGTSTNAPINNPHQIKDIMDLQHQALGQEQGHEALAMHLLQTQFPPDPAVVEYAKRNLGITSPSTNAPAALPGKPTASTGDRGALGVFLNRALPTGVGAGSAMMTGAKMPGPWPLKLAAGGTVGLIGDRLTRMAMGDLTPEEEKAHPTAAMAGDVTGLLAGLIAGGKGRTAQTAMGPSTGIPASALSRVAGMFKRTPKSPMSGYQGQTPVEAPVTAPPTPPMAGYAGKPMPGVTEELPGFVKPPVTGPAPGSALSPMVTVPPSIVPPTTPAPLDFNDPRVVEAIRRWFQGLPPSAPPP